MRRDTAGAVSRTLTVDGLKTHLLEAGDGPPVVLLHSGEYGASAQTTWGEVIPRLVDAGYHAVAPDWLGFGDSDKVVDFADPTGRRLRHMASTIAQLGLGAPAFVGNSMGGTYLARMLSNEEPLFKASAAVLVSGGGFVPHNEARERILDYDLTIDGMRNILSTVMYQQHLANDDEYVRWRHQLSLTPGGWECSASARLRAPNNEASTSEFGKADDTRYEAISVPTLLIAGAQDPLRLPGYAEELADRIPDCEVETYDKCGHMPNLEYPDRFGDDLLSFLERRYR